ncbi:Protein of unknown function [Weissella confusa LBAE C39-2]|jgi:hypothetical protein
MQVK